MTDKQKLKSIENKMDRIQKYVPDLDLNMTSANFFYIEKYFNLSREHFFLKFEIENCTKCGKKLKENE